MMSSYCGPGWPTTVSFSFLAAAAAAASSAWLPLADGAAAPDEDELLDGLAPLPQPARATAMAAKIPRHGRLNLIRPTSIPFFDSLHKIVEVSAGDCRHLARRFFERLCSIDDSRR